MKVYSTNRKEQEIRFLSDCENFEVIIYEAQNVLQIDGTRANMWYTEIFEATNLGCEDYTAKSSTLIEAIADARAWLGANA